MDTDIAGWILEFCLRQNSMDDRTLNKLISVLSLPDHNLTLKKSLLLRKIESDISKSRLSESILELLEMIQELDLREGIAEVSEAMKGAYCAVAVHCTFRLLLEGETGVEKYSNVVKTVWKGRAHKMEEFFDMSVATASGMGLVSNELRSWMGDIKAGVWETTVCKNVSVGKYRRGREVLEVVQHYVDEAKEKMGPSFLELVAQTLSEDDLREVMGLEKVIREPHKGDRGEKSPLITSLLKRRPRKAWSIEEENALWIGVKKHGKGNWKLILNMYPDIFVGRSMVDLKDKWRNMSRCEPYYESKNIA